MRSLTGLLARAVCAAVSLFIPCSIFAVAPAAVLDLDHASARAVVAVQNQVTPDWMREAAVLGTAVGADANGAAALTVYIDRDASNAGEVIRNLPRNVRGVGVQIELTDKFRAMLRPGGGGGGGVSHTAIQSPPIQLGTSGGWSSGPSSDSPGPTRPWPVGTPATRFSPGSGIVGGTSAWRC